MPGNPVRIGPFVGGLNNKSQSGEAKDNQVTTLINFEVGSDTALISRPPLELVSGTSIRDVPGNWEMLGIFRVTDTDWYLIVNKPLADGSFEARSFPKGNFSGASTLIKTSTAVNKVVSFVQYNDWAYFNVATGASDTGFRWQGGTVDSIATMPRGRVMVSWKDRLWITGNGTSATGNTVWFSTVDATGPKPNTWNTSTDFFNVFPGQGGFNTAMLPMANSMLIFKSDGTYRWSFQGAPKNGELNIVSTETGAANQDCVVSYDGTAYTYDQGKVFQLINSRYDPITFDILFNTDGTEVDALAPGVQMSVVNRRIMVRYFNTLYVYATDTQTWSKWNTLNGTPAKFLELPSDSNSNLPSMYVAGTAGNQQSVGVQRIFDTSLFDANRLGNWKGTNPINSVMEDTAYGYLNLFRKAGQTDPIIYLNANGVPTNYDQPVTEFQVYQFSIQFLAFNGINGTGSLILGANSCLDVIFTYLNKNGTTSTVTLNMTANDSGVVKDLTIPANTYLMSIAIRINLGANTDGKLLLVSNTARFISKDTTSPTRVVRLIDFNGTYQNTNPIEYITCAMETKSYDYQANSVFKRLFLWGLDAVTPRPILLMAKPLGKKNSVLWGDLEMYTHAQLAQGTWGNPLSWKLTSNTVIDPVTENIDISENNRFFVKAKKSLRFRQIQYYVEMTTLGNSQSGPAKIFSLTSYTSAKEMVVDKAT